MQKGTGISRAPEKSVASCHVAWALRSLGCELAAALLKSRIAWRQAMGLSLGPGREDESTEGMQQASLRRGTLLPNQTSPSRMRSHAQEAKADAGGCGWESIWLDARPQPCCPPPPGKRSAIRMNWLKGARIRDHAGGEAAMADRGCCEVPKRVVSRRSSRCRFDWMAVVDSRFKLDLASPSQRARATKAAFALQLLVSSYRLFIRLFCLFDSLQCTYFGTSVGRQSGYRP